MSLPASQKYFAPLVLALMAAGAAAILYVTRHGAGVTLDAVYYLSEARTWVATGHMVIPDFYGGIQPTTHWPPLYPLLLAVFGHFTGDAPSGARWLGAVVFALNIMLVAWLGRRAAQSPWGGLASAFVFACAPAVLLVHASIMSEAPCLAWWLLSVLLLLRYQDSESSGLLAASALAAGLAIFTRYGAVAVIPAAVFFLLVYGRSPVARRLGLALVYALIAAVPTAIYLILHLRSDPPLTRTIHWPAAEAQRHFHYFGITSQQMLASIRAFEEWLCPVDAWSFHFRLVFFVLFGAGLLFGLGQMFRAGKNSAADQPPRGRVSALFLANGVAYLTVILLTGMFFDPALDMSSRMYLPAFVFALLLAAACWPFLREAVLARPRGAMFGVAGALLLLLLGV
jgi:4-amino-4-deoxy-L-arabinose transferase-like glycosyltransferase